MVIRHWSFHGGYAALTATLLTVIVSLTIISGLTFFAFQEVNTTRVFTRSLGSRYVSEGGIEDALYRVVTGKQITSGEALGVGSGTTTVIVSAVGNQKIIRSEGRRDNFQQNLETEVDVTASGINFYYGVQVGDGGVEMDENAQIVGNVYSNGSIAGDSGAKITGDVTIAGNVELNERSIVCGQDQIFGQSNPVIDMAQSFRPNKSGQLVRVGLYLKKFSNPANRNIRITADTGGSPASTSLASAQLNASLVTESYGWIDVVFSSPANLVQNNIYWIVFDADRDSNKYWSWCKDQNSGYGNGSAKYSQDWDDDPWTAVTGDLAFKTYLGSGITSIDNAIVGGTARVNTITNSKICGDTYYQSIDASSLNFLNSPTSPTCDSPFTPGTGYPDQNDPPSSNMPISPSNIDQWKSDAAAGGTINGNCGDNGVAECVIGDNNTLTLGPKKVTGNLVLTKKQTLVISGTIWFQGYIDIDSSSGATIKCDSSYGQNSCLILTDSWIHIKNNAVFQGSGTTGSYLMALTTLPCKGIPAAGCTHHDAAIDIHNSATGVIFYASDGMINLHNNVNITEATAYKLRIDNNSTVTYEQGLANAKFSSGPAGGYEVKYWREVE